MTKTKTLDGIEQIRSLLHDVLMRLRWDDQHGFPGFRNGKWDGDNHGLPVVSTQELTKLMAFAGVVPDEIIPKGACRDCKFAVCNEGGEPTERGWAPPCVSCLRPYHDCFEQIKDAKAVCERCGKVERFKAHVDGSEFHHEFRKG